MTDFKKTIQDITKDPKEAKEAIKNDYNQTKADMANMKDKVVNKTKEEKDKVEMEMGEDM